MNLTDEDGKAIAMPSRLPALFLGDHHSASSISIGIIPKGCGQFTKRFQVNAAIRPGRHVDTSGTSVAGPSHALHLLEDGLMARIPGRIGDRADDLEFGPQDLECAAGSAVPVLITTGSPTERESYARLIHNNGTRQRGPFITIRCDSDQGVTLPRTLEGARGGTLFLDEIGRMNIPMQRQLLALMDSGEVGARIIAGTSRSLVAEIAAGTFNEALFYRLNVIHLRFRASTSGKEPR